MFKFVPSEVNKQILCYYFNPTNQMQIARITNIPNCYFEKVVFPKQRLMFEALPEALLEIDTGIMPSGILSEKIECHLLRVKEEVSQIHIESNVA